MPYIKQERREPLDTGRAHPAQSGELNYKITQVIRDYWDFHGPAYQTINDIVGALEGVKLEFYRRIAVPYEEQKIKDNGDVYT